MGMMQVVDPTGAPPPLSSARPVSADAVVAAAADAANAAAYTSSSHTPRAAPRPPPGRMAPGLNGSVFGGANAHSSWPVRGLGADHINSQSRSTVFPNGGVGLVLGLALGAAAGGLLLAMAVVAVLLKKWYGTRQKTGLEFDMDDRMTINSSRSAPNTRSNTPDSMRRSKTNLMRSITMDMISIETEMTSIEAVQPESPPDDVTSYKGSTQTLYNQRHLPATYRSMEAYNSAFEPDEGRDEKTQELNPPSLAYSVVYDSQSEKLTVNVIKAAHLKGRPPNNSARDPFVKVCVLPDERTKQQGRVQRRTQNPLFNDSFAFYVSRKEMSKRTVRISVYDIDKRRVRHTLGHVFIPLHRNDMTSGEVRWDHLQQKANLQGHADLGKLQLTLTCLPSAEEVHLTVGSIRGLHRLRLGNREGICARAVLLQSGRPFACQKTTVVYDISPEGHLTWGEPMRFAVPIRQLDACSFRVSLIVMHLDGGPDEMGVEFGHVTVGSHLYAQKAGYSHWFQMVNNARSPVMQWHEVAPPLVTPTTSPESD